MSLSAFIRDHHEPIIVEFAAFAKTLMPPDISMSEQELRDHAEEILTEIFADMQSSQTSAERAAKSRGLGTSNGMRKSGRLHADDRILHGYNLPSVIAEFRALRATVLKLYESNGGTDLTEVRRFNESIDEALTESLGRFTAQTELLRDQFIGILSHDLRNPLGVIAAGASILAAPEDNPQKRMRLAAMMLNSCQRMTRMISDLLDLTLTRLGGKIPIAPARMQLEDVCKEVLMEMRAAYVDATLHFEKSGQLVGEWDADRLTQVLSNLVGNAIQHGAGTPVTLAAKDEGDTVRLTVHNGGKPIPPTAIRSIFEPLRRVQTGGPDIGPARSIGLGLFIAREIVRAHGGEITVTSSSDSGTTFSVLLPKRVESLRAA